MTFPSSRTSRSRARSMRPVDVDRPIPADFYRAVAEIVHLIQQRKARMGPTKTMKPAGRAPGASSVRRANKSSPTRWWTSPANCRLTDAAELMSMIRNDHAANIADLVNSSTELFFKSGTLRYALSASFKAPWDATPVVEIDMEFRHAAVSCLLSPEDRSAPRGGRDHRHSVRRAGPGRLGEGGTPFRRPRQRATAGPASRKSRGKPHARRAAQD